MKTFYSLLALLVMQPDLFAQAKKYPMFEHFTQTNCPPCADQNPIFENNILKPNEGVIHHVQIHAWWPGANNDPMYTSNRAQDSAIIRSYAVQTYGVPDMFMNGKEKHSPASIYQYMIDEDTAMGSPIAIIVTQTGTSSSQNVSVRVATAGTMPTGTFVLKVAIVEKELNYATAPGTNGEKYFPNVLRKMLTNSAGNAFMPASQGSSVTTSYSFSLDPAWNADQIYVLAWVQDSSSKDIINSGSSNDLTGTLTASHAAGNAVNVSWTAPPAPAFEQTAGKIISYSLYRGRKWTSVAYVGSMDGALTNYNDVVPSSGTYYYAIRAIYETDSSTLSVRDSATVPFVRTFAGATGTYTALASPTIISFTDNNEGAAGPFDIGFPFVYDGAVYTKFSVAANGHIRLGNSATLGATATKGIDAIDTSGILPLLAPFMDDLNNLNTNLGSVSYKSAAGVLTVEYKDINNNKTASPSRLQMQVKLYQTSNDIEFAYGTQTPSGTDWTGAIGVTNSQGGKNNFYSVQQNASPFSASQTTAANGLTAPPANGTVLRFTQQNAPEIFFSTSPIENAVEVGLSKDITFLVENAGSAQLDVSSVALTGAQASEYQIISPAVPFSVAVGANTEMKIHFTPGDAGVRSASLVFTHNGAGSPTSLALNARGTKIGMSSNRSALDYGIVSRSSVTDSIIVVTNTGSDPLDVTGYTFSQTTSSHFEVTDPAAPFTIPAMSSQNVTVRFNAPSTKNIFVDTLTVNNSINKPVAIALKGETGAPVVSAASQIDFGSVASGTTSDTSLHVRNTGNLPLVVTAITKSGDTGNEFSVSSSLPDTLGPGGEIFYPIHFAPTSGGTRSVRLDVANNSETSPFPTTLIANVTIGVSTEKEVASEFSLDQNYPNPFTQLSMVRCQLSANGVFEVRDMLGRVIEHLSIDSNTKQITVDASDLRNGLYLYSLSDGRTIQSRMMMVVK